MRLLGIAGARCARHGWSGAMALPLVAALAGTGCGSDGSEIAGSGAIVSDSAGVEIVLNTGPGWSPAEAWRLEPDLLVGELDGPLTFGRLVWVGPGHDDQMLVLDRQSNVIHVFDRQGTHVGEFGGEGEGPGEFRSPASVLPVGDDRLAVAESFPPALHWLDKEGVYLDSFRPAGARAEDGTRSAAAFGAWQVTGTGLVFAQFVVFAAGSESELEAPVHLIRYSTDGADTDTILTWTVFQPTASDSEIRLLGPEETWAPGADGSVFLSPGLPYEIRQHRPSGELHRIVRRQVEPVPVTTELRQAAAEDFRSGMEDSGAPANFIEQFMDRLVFEAELPPVLRVWASEPDGHLWAGVYDPATDPDATAFAANPWHINAWDVFGPTGAFRGRLAAPEGFWLTAVTEEAVYGVWQDELEVPFARRYQIVRPPAE